MAGLSNEALQKLMLGDPDADFTIVCKDYSFPCHHLILKAGSEYFAQKFTKPSPVPLTATLPVDDPETIGRMIQFLYMGYYPINEKPIMMPKQTSRDEMDTTLTDASEDEDDDPSDDSGHMWTMFSRMIADLKKQTMLYQAAHKYGVRNLQDHILNAMNGSFTDMIVDHGGYAALLELVYTCTARDDAGLRFFFTERTLNSPWFLSHPRLAEIINHHEQMAYRVWKRTNDRSQDLKRARKHQRAIKKQQLQALEG